MAVGQEVDPEALGPEQRREHRAKLRQGLSALAGMLTGSSPSPGVGGGREFDSGAPQVGLELELVLVDPATWAPTRANQRVLDRIAGTPDADLWGPEISAHTLELNSPPTVLAGRGLVELEEGLRSRLDAAGARAREAGTRLLMTGLLPTLLPEHLEQDWMTRSARYRALQEAVLAARGEDVEIDIDGTGDGADGTGGGGDEDGLPGERLLRQLGSLAAEGACTSTQVHLKVAPEDFADTWNAAQLLMGPQVALGANSPFAFGQRVWAETRIPLFTQAVDVRPLEHARGGVPPRVFPGSGWLDAGRDPLGAWTLFAENVRRFPPLLPQNSDEDPSAELAAGRVPTLAELCLHGGTVWRWNRPVYDVTPARDGLPARPHLRIENRVLPAAPTVLDAVTDAAVWLGAVRGLREAGPDPSVLLEHDDAVAGLLDAARSGLRAQLPWPGRGKTDARALLLDVVLPLAADGLAAAGVDGAVVDRYLDVAQARAASGQNGAVWQVRAAAALQARGADRATALAGVVERYAEHMEAGEPVHTWPAVT